MPSSDFRAPWGAGWALPIACLLLFATLSGVGPAFSQDPATPPDDPAQPQAEPAPAPPEPAVEAGPAPTLIEQLERDFRVLKLRRGLVLEPRADLGIEAIEVSADGYAIDGEPVTAAELSARLGSSADLIRELAQRSPEELMTILEEADTGVMEVSQPVAPVDPVDPAAPAPPRPPRRPRRSGEADVVFGSDLRVESGQTRREVVVFGGDLWIEGTVLGDAVAIAGDVWIDGEVTGDVALVASEGRIGPNAVIEGELIQVGSDIEVDAAAVVHGQIVDVPFGHNLNFDFGGVGDWWRWGANSWGWQRPFDRALEFLWELFSLAVLALLVCLGLLVAPGPVRRIGARVGEEPWKAGLTGLLAQILFLPLLLVVVVVLTISVIGIPLLLLVPFALLGLVLVGFLGFAGVVLRIGEWARERFGWGLASPYVALLVGLAIVQVWSLLGEALGIAGGPLRVVAVPFLLFGGLLQYVTWTLGFGGALLTRFGAGPRRVSAAPAPPPPVAPDGYLAVPEAAEPDGVWEDESEPSERPEE